MNELPICSDLINDIKNRIRQGQIKAAVSATLELISIYWDIGKILTKKQMKKGWEAKVIPKISRDNAIT